MIEPFAPGLVIIVYVLIKKSASMVWASVTLEKIYLLLIRVAGFPSTCTDAVSVEYPELGVTVQVESCPWVTGLGIQLIEPFAPETVVIEYVFRLKVAIQVLLESIKTVVGLIVPEQSPDHPAKVELAKGVAVRSTDDPPVNEALQVSPQLMPAGVLVTVPPPVPVLFTVRVLSSFSTTLRVTSFALYATASHCLSAGSAGRVTVENIPLREP
jgi:hypothetical protein